MCYLHNKLSGRDKLLLETVDKLSGWEGDPVPAGFIFQS
jgi:hypothetical protein